MQSLLQSRRCYRQNFKAHLFNLLERKKHFSTIDVNDVEHHSKLADEWWNPQGPVAPLHTLNSIRYI